MVKTLSAVYENGMLRPLEPLQLDEHRQVRVTISADPWLGHEYMAPLTPYKNPNRRWRMFAASSLRNLAISPMTFGWSGTREVSWHYGRKTGSKTAGGPGLLSRALPFILA
jgi:predicted DNA-binding antitoxin AbrB/MazE fold protein